MFGLIQINGRQNESKKLLAEAIIKKTKTIIKELKPGTSPARNFEQTLAEINQTIAEHTEKHTHINIQDFNGVIGLIWKNQIFLSGIGNLPTVFLHKTNQKRFTIYELSEQFQDNEQNWEKPFITILDGEINPGDIFYLATRVPTREIHQEELQNILVTLPPAGALKRIEQHIGINTPYAGITFQAITIEPKGPPKKVNPMMSINELDQTQNTTASLLNEQTLEVTSLTKKYITPLTKKLFAPGTKGPKTTIKRTIRTIIKTIAIPIRKKETKEKPKTATKKQPKTSIKTKLANLGNPVKYGILGLMIALCLLFGGLSLSKFQKSQTTTESLLSTTITQIEENIHAAEASLIYDNKTQALEQLDAAESLITTLSEEGKEKAAELTTSINTIKAAIQGFQPVQTTSLATSMESSKFSSMLTAANSIYLFTNDKNVYQYQFLDGELTKEDATFGSITAPTKSASDDTAQVFLDTDGNLGKFFYGTTTLNPIVSGIPNLESAEDIDLFNGNLYTLSAATEQIIKMRPQGDNFEAGTAWITSLSSSLSTAKAFTIDGDIYILSDQKITKLTSGKEQSWNTETIDPPIQSATDIQTTPDSSYLYILDSANARIIVVNKDGSITTQYTADALSQTTSFIIDEESKTATILTPTELQKFTLMHLVR